MLTTALSRHCLWRLDRHSNANSNAHSGYTQAFLPLPLVLAVEATDSPLFWLFWTGSTGPGFFEVFDTRPWLRPWFRSQKYPPQPEVLHSNFDWQTYSPQPVEFHIFRIPARDALERLLLLPATTEGKSFGLQSR